MKKKILVVSAMAACAAILTSGTLAYFTAEDEAHNVITSGAIDIEIEEWQKIDNGLIPFPENKPVEMMPGTTVSKIATIKNKESEAYIRAKFETVVTGADGKVMELTPETLASIVSLTMNDEYWVRKQGDNEWWYYTKAVDAGASTEAFFTEVVFDGLNMTNEYQNSTVEIDVNAQAVQAANNGDSAIEAAGWPEE